MVLFFRTMYSVMIHLVFVALAWMILYAVNFCCRINGPSSSALIIGSIIGLIFRYFYLRLLAPRSAKQVC